MKIITADLIVSIGLSFLSLAIASRWPWAAFACSGAALVLAWRGLVGGTRDSTRSAIALALFVAATVIGFSWFTWTGWAIAATLALAAVFLTPFD